MSRNKLFSIAAPLCVAASVLTIALTVSNPRPAVADVTTTGQGMPSLAPMLKTVTPAVVNIAVTSKVEIQNPLMQDPLFRRFFGIPDDQQQQPEEREAQAVGSGVIVDASKGYILTNNHVVEQADSIKVLLTDDREFDAKLIGRDPQTDVAVLQIDAKNLSALKMADSDQLQVGDYVVAIGSPFGLRHTVTSGIVSGLSRQTGISDGGYEDFIQTDASINPGNSGGALVNLNGELVGIPSNILSRSGGNIGIGFAIPINLARSVMGQLVAHGEVQRGRIGVTGQDLTPELAKSFGLDSSHGAIITQVLPDSPADKAGLKVEDIILKVNGKEVTNFQQVRNTVGLMTVGDKVALDVLRNGKPKSITVVIGKETDLVAQGQVLHPGLAGATFATAEVAPGSNRNDTHGVVIQAVAPGSPAARNGLRPGDIITSVQRREVQNMEDFQKLTAVKEGDLLLRVVRGSAAAYVVIH